MNEHDTTENDLPPSGYQGIFKVAAALTALSAAVFLLWATTAPLDEALTAQGTVVVSGYRQAVQAPQLATVARVLVKEGVTVKQGQAVVLFDTARIETELELARTQWIGALAIESRLTAERNAQSDISFPAELLRTNAEPRTSRIMSQQRELLRARQAAQRAELATLQQSISTLGEQVKGAENLLTTQRLQMRLLQEQLSSERTLANQGFIPRNRVLELERTSAQISSGLEETQSLAARLTNQQIEIRSRIQQRERETRRDLERELAEAQHEAELQRRRIDRLELEKKLTTLEAPSDGRVVGLAVHSAGAVVTAGATLLEIVPDHQPLHVEAQLPTQGIDRIKPGDQVQILFTSFNAATTPRVNGTLLTVAADALQDPTTRVPSYKILVEVSPDSLNGLKYSDLKPGMQAQVFISTGTRTFFDYLTRPVLDRMRKAFIEQ